MIQSAKLLEHAPELDRLPYLVDILFYVYVSSDSCSYYLNRIVEWGHNHLELTDMVYNFGIDESIQSNNEHVGGISLDNTSYWIIPCKSLRCYD